MASDDHRDPDPEPIELPIDGILDLHTFRPQDVGHLVDDYLEACAEKGLREVRIIHGKGRGTLRETVHVRLRRNPRVASFNLATDRGGWGATVVSLRKE